MSAHPLAIGERFQWVASALAKQSDSLARSLPPGLPVSRFTQIATNALRRNPVLLQCYLQTIVDAVIFSADMGLEIGGPTGEAYIVPFWNGKRKRKEAKFIPGYRGLIKLALEDDTVTGIEAQVVRDGDRFDYEYGTESFLRHKPSETEVGPVTYAYAIAQKRGARAQFQVLSRTQLDAVRDEVKRKAGASWQYSPWVTKEDEMQRKTVVRNLAKYLDLRADKLHKAIASEDEDSYGSLPLDDTSKRDDAVARAREGAGANRIPDSVQDAEWEDNDAFLGDEP